MSRLALLARHAGNMPRHAGNMPRHNFGIMEVPGIKHYSRIIGEKGGTITLPRKPVS